jgi:hypothetical protein
MRHLPLALILATTAACAGDQEDLVGRWRAAHGGEIEFFDDGTLTVGSRTGTAGGARFALEEGRLRLEHPLLGPVSLPIEMHADSFRVEGQGLLGRGETWYYRDRGTDAPVLHALQAGSSVRGTCTETTRFMNGSSRVADVPVEAVFTEGELVLDPLTHSFTQTLTLELRAGTTPDGVMHPHLPLRGVYRGRYVEHDRQITLDYEGVDSLTQVQGRREGGQVVLPTEAFFRVLWLRSGFHDDDLGYGRHRLAWGPLPSLAFSASSK